MASNEEDKLQSTLESISPKPNVHLKLLSIFLTQFETDAQQLERSVTDMDHSNIFQTAHKLKSALKIFDQEMYDHVSLLEKYGSEKESCELIKTVYSNFSDQVKCKIPVLQKAKDQLETELNLKH